MAHPFGIQQPEFEALLAWLGPTRDQAGEKYELIRHQLLRYFEGHHCEPADEHVDTTIDRVAKRVAGGEQILSADPVRYFYGVAKNVFLESRKHQVASQQPRTGFPAAGSELAGAAARKGDSRRMGHAAESLKPRRLKTLQTEASPQWRPPSGNQRHSSGSATLAAGAGLLQFSEGYGVRL